WRGHLLERLRRQAETTADPVVAELCTEIAAYPAPRPTGPHAAPNPNAVAIPFQLITEAGTLSFISTTTVFGTPVDITLSDLAIEAFFPANAETAEALRRMAK